MVTGTVQNIGRMGVVRAGAVSRSTTQKAAPVTLGAPERTTGGDEVLFSRRQPDILRTGFGQGTVSLPTAAIRTLGKGIEGVRQMVPTTEELREELRTRAAELRETQQQELDDRRARIAEAPPLANAVEQARGYLQDVGNAAATAQARLAGEQVPEAAGARATVEIGGQSFGYVRRDGQNTDAMTARMLDVTV